MAINCPFCKKPLKNKLIVDFYFCKECEVAVRNEIDMPLSETNIYDRDWVRSQESGKANFMRASYVLKQVKRLHKIRTVLDVGCGTGILVDTLNRNGYIANGVDTSPDAIEFAKSCRKGDFHLTSIECFRSEYKYDLVIAAQLIEHLRNPEKFLTAVKKVLKPRGYLYIETPNLYSWSKKSIWRRRIGGMFYGTDHRILYTSKNLVRLLRYNNFDIYKIFTRTFLSTIFVEIINTLILLSKKRRKIKAQKESLVINPTGNKTKDLIKSVCKNVNKQVKDSFIVNALLFIPNRISEIKGRGNQLIVIAKNGS